MKPVYSRISLLLQYSYNLAKNLNSINLNIGDKIVIGLNYSFSGIFGNALFKATNLACTIYGNLFNKLESQRFVNNYNFLVFFNHVSEIKSQAGAF